MYDTLKYCYIHLLELLWESRYPQIRGPSQWPAINQNDAACQKTVFD